MARRSTKVAVAPETESNEPADGLVFEAAFSETGDYLKFGRDDQGTLVLQIPRAAAASLITRGRQFEGRSFFVAFLHRRPA
jgi:hypothetical protein